MEGWGGDNARIRAVTEEIWQLQNPNFRIRAVTAESDGFKIIHGVNLASKKCKHLQTTHPPPSWQGGGGLLPASCFNRLFYFFV